MKLAPTTLAFALLPLLAIGCRDTSQTGPVTVSRFIELNDAAWITRLSECNPAFSRHYSVGSLMAAPDVYGSGIAAGRLAFREDRVEACIDARLKRSCPTAVGGATPAACYQVFEPQVAPGGECYLDEECIGGWCSLDGCPGVCVAYVLSGESCAEGRCDPATSYCDLANRTCHSREALSGSCEYSSGCIDELLCHADSCVAPDSIPLAGLGESCGDCAAGLYCSSLAAGILAGECKQLPGPEEGAACDSNNLCGEDMVCAGPDDGRRCLTWAELGESCLEIDPDSSGATGCKIGLVCMEGRCEMPPVVGPCEGQSFCLMAVSYCSDEGQCEPLKAAGESCDWSFQCASRRCDGTCVKACTP